MPGAGLVTLADKLLTAALSVLMAVGVELLATGVVFTGVLFKGAPLEGALWITGLGMAPRGWLLTAAVFD